MEKLYTAEATVTGGGRNGHVTSADGILDVDVKMPKELGGPAGAHFNPELFFAAGYAACFDSALGAVARAEKLSGFSSSTTAAVTIGKDDSGFGLSVALTVDIPGVDKAVAADLAHKAHQMCPYSKATRNNIEVTINVK